MSGVRGNIARRGLKSAPSRNRIDSGSWWASSLSFPAHALDLQLSPNIAGFLRCPTAGPGISGCPGGNPGSGIPPNLSSVVMFVGNNSPYMASTKYQVTLVSPRDTNGVPLTENYTWSFTPAPN